MKTVNGFIQQTRKWSQAALVLAAMGTSLASCDGLFHNEDELCYDVFLRTSGYVQFSYDHNIKFADAFHNEVQQVKLFVFDTDGNYLKTLEQPIGEIIAHDNMMTINEDDLQPGEYQFLAWAACNTGFSHFDLKQGDRIEDFECHLDRLTDSEGRAYRDTDCGRLFHCLKQTVKMDYVCSPHLTQLNDLPLYRHQVEELYGKEYITLNDSVIITHKTIVQMPLVKNTNTFHIALQQQNGEALNPADYDFRIVEEVSGLLAFDNAAIDTTTLNFCPWHIQATGIDDAQKPEASRAGEITDVSGVVADITTSRLMDDSNVDRRRLIVTNTATGKQIVNLPLIDMLLLVKGKYAHPLTGETLSNQEYLDRQDDYSLIFVLESGRWLGASIYINSWHVVLQNSSL